jgi:nonsense-mediated mRNA decay protein 3
MQDDLVCLPKLMARSMANISQIVLCSRVSNNVMFVDPLTGAAAEMRTPMFWEKPFPALCETKDLVEFYVIDIQIESRNGKYAIATAEISKAQDLSQSWLVRTHLGNILNPGDHAKGFILANSNFNNDDYDGLITRKMKGEVPDIILVRKSYPNARKHNKNRNWKLKSMAKTEEMEANRTKAEKLNAEKDLEMFLREVEEDPELRGMMNLFKNDVPAVEDEEMIASDEEPEADFPEIHIDELMDDIAEMNLGEDINISEMK